MEQPQNLGKPNRESSGKREEHHVLSRFFYEQLLREDLASRNEGGVLQNSFKDIKFYPGVNTREGKLKLLISNANTRFAKFFVKKKDEYKKLLVELASRNYTDDEEMLKEIANAIYEFAKANFTREELEERYRDRKHKIPLNEILDCNKDKQDPHRLRVHLIGTSHLTPAKVREGFGVLAKKLKENDSALEGVETITLTSWMIWQRPEIFEKLGFTILEANEIDKGKQSRRSEITREKFIEMYLPKTQTETK